MSDAPSRLIDLSHTVYHGLETYPGLPGPAISDYMSHEASRQHYAPGTVFHIGRIDLVANTGTYVDAPFHRFPERTDLSQLPLAAVADLPGLMVEAQAEKQRALEASLFAGLELAGKAVLVRTGWSRHWGSKGYFEGYPFLTEAAARHLVGARAALVGIDSLNIDDNSDPRRPVHTALLAAELPVVEHLTNLERLPAAGFRFFAVPVKIEGMGSFPVRAFAVLKEGGSDAGAAALRHDVG